jgi:predicted ATPase
VDGAVRPSFELHMQQYGLLRPLRTAELSDGTLRYLFLIAALLSPRPPELMILNEPEASLHPDLLPSLARLMGKASANSQILLVSHSPELVAALEKDTDVKRITLEKQLGETVIPDAQAPGWTWPSR